MNYEKKYNEALERAKKVKHDVENIGCSMAPDMLEVIFPELAEPEYTEWEKELANALYRGVGVCCMDGMLEVAKEVQGKVLVAAKKELERLHELTPHCEATESELKESEDERIRRELVEYLKGDLDDITTDDTDRWIRWIEKQKDCFLVPKSHIDPIGEPGVDGMELLKKQKLDVKDLFAKGPGHYFYDGDKVHFCSAPAVELREPEDAKEQVEQRTCFKKEEFEKDEEKQKEYVSDNFDDVWTMEDCAEIIETGEKLSPRFKELLKEACHAWYDKGIELGKQEEQKPMDKPFEDWLDGWYKEHEEDGEIIMNAAEFKNWSRGIKNMCEQKPVQSEDEREYVRTLKSLISDFLRGKDHIDRGYYQKIYDWLDGRHVEQEPVEIKIDNPNVQKIDYDMKISTSDSSASEDEILSVRQSLLKSIQKSWYMEGYHDCEFGYEPRWIIKTGEGGPRYEENPKYGQHIEEKPAWWSVKGRRGRIGNTPEHIRKKAENFLSKMEPPYDADDICSAYETGAMENIKQEWRKNDTVFLNEIIDFFANGTVRLQHDLTMYAHWLKSLPERFNLQPKQEWSKEDEKMIERLITRLNWITHNTRTNGTSPNITFFDEIEWLKSLRPSWKPSEEQMEALEKAIIKVHSTDEIPILTELRQQLKKLM